MYQHPQELIFEDFVEQLGILFHSVETNQNAAGYNVPDTFVEGDDVGVCIMIQEGDVLLNHVIIVTENIRDIARDFTLVTNHLMQPHFM